MKSVLEVLKLSTEYLQKHQVVQPRRQAEDLLCDALTLSRLELYLQFERPLTAAELDRCRSWLVRRGKGEPLQQIRGEVEFLNCLIKVTPAVLIPRQETEILVDKIIKVLAKEELAGKCLWDLCCGSGCIGIAIKRQLPALEVHLSDISCEALQIAEENGRLNQVRLSFSLGDLLQPFQGQRADFIICNPPYIAEGEYSSLDREVRDYEPKGALIAGSSGLEFYRRLAEELPAVLVPGGRVWLEIGKGQGKNLLDLFCQPHWKRVSLESDWAGHDRFFSLEME
jgi:release factor glutamine methyltransferase